MDAPNEVSGPHRARRAVALIAGALTALGLASLVYLQPSLPSDGTIAVTPAPSAVAPALFDPSLGWVPTTESPPGHGWTFTTPPSRVS